MALGALLLALLLAVIPAHALDCEQDFSGLFAPHAACAAAERRQLVESIRDACQVATGCLIDEGLNPALGRRVLSILESRRVRIDCVDRTASGAGGGEATTHADGSSDVIMVTWPPAEARPGEMLGFTHALFHELIHATDPQERRHLSHDLHNRPGFPDGTYGCHLACQGRFSNPIIGKQVELYEEAAVAALPELSSWRCEGSARMCQVVRQYAWLCRNNGPFINQQVRDRQGLLSGTECVAAAIRQPADATLFQIVQAVDEHRSASLPESQRRLGAILDRDGVVASCMSDPTSY